MKIQCPTCNQQYDIPDTLCNTELQCTSCKTTFIIEGENPAEPSSNSKQETKNKKTGLKMFAPSSEGQNKIKTTAEQREYRSPIICTILDIVGWLNFLGVLFGIMAIISRPSIEYIIYTAAFVLSGMLWFAFSMVIDVICKIEYRLGILQEQKR